MNFNLRRFSLMHPTKNGCTKKKDITQVTLWSVNLQVIFKLKTFRNVVGSISSAVLSMQNWKYHKVHWVKCHSTGRGFFFSVNENESAECYNPNCWMVMNAAHFFQMPKSHQMHRKNAFSMHLRLPISATIWILINKINGWCCRLVAISLTLHRSLS